MQRRYRTQGFVMADGERYRLLVDPDSGVPLYYPNLFLTTQLRNASKSVASMDAAAAAINVLLTYCAKRGIDLEKRISGRRFFSSPELDAIRDECQNRFSRQDDAKVVRFRRSRVNQRIGAVGEYSRLTHIANYVRWLSNTLLGSDIDESAAYQIKAVHAGFIGRRPIGKRRTVVKNGPSPEQVSALQEVMNPAGGRSPFRGPSLRVRNALIVDLLFYLGIRGGELLNIRIGDIDWGRHQIVIARRPDESKDPRARQPLVKTLDRRIPLRDTLVDQLHTYVVKHRNKVPGARTHDYLFVTHKSGRTQGQPLSISGYQKIIKVIAAASPELEGLHGHLLRHGWNERFSEHMDRLEDPPSPERQEAVRSYAQGWKEGSLKGNIKGDAVQRRDPGNGDLTENELIAFNEGAARAFEKCQISTADLAMALLTSCTGRRARQISHMKVMDVELSARKVSGELQNLIQVPRAKQQGGTFRDSFGTFRPSDELWRVIQAQRKQCIDDAEKAIGRKLDARDQSWLPLFPDVDAIRACSSFAEFHALLAKDRFHCSPEAINDVLRRVVELSRVYSERTGKLLNVSSRRFRYTTGTRAARQGIGIAGIAELLDHTDTQNAQVYVKNIPEHVEAIDAAVGLQLAPYAQAFQGVLVDSERDARRGDDPTSRISHRGRDAATCGKFGRCGANVPIPCYTCIYFQPWLNGPHEMVYAELLADIYFEDGWLHFHRSWTGAHIFALSLGGCASGVRVVDGWASRDPREYRSPGTEQDRQTVVGLIHRYFGQ